MSLAVLCVLCAVSLGQAQPAPADVPVAPAAPTAVPAAPTAPAAERASAIGQVQCAIFAGDTLVFVVGATVSAPGGSSAVTDARGNAFITLPAGTHALEVTIPSSALPQKPKSGAQSVAIEVGNVVVVADDRTRVLLEVSEVGEPVDIDVQVPEVSEPLAGPVPAEGAPLDSTTALVSGEVVSTADGAPIAGAELYVVGLAAEATTDAAGHFALQLPLGMHSLSIVHPDYLGQTLDGVEAVAGAESVVQVRLEPAAATMDTYVIRAARIEGSVATVLEARRAATSFNDAVGQEEMSRMPGSNAAAAAQRIVGATILDGKYLYVRGLGGRYTNVRLNGVPVPATDPDVPGVQLDLFPSALLNDMTVAKTFTADIPGDFAGGSMNIVTRTFPEQFEASATAGTGFNSESTFQDLTTYPGGKTDFLGWDDGTRQLPDAVPDQKLEKGTARDPGFSQDDINEIAKDFPSNWETRDTFGLPDIRLGGNVGNTFQVGGRPLGMMLSLNYKHELREYEKEIGKVRLEGDSVSQKELLHEDVTKSEAALGGLANVGYRLADGHELQWVSFFTQVGVDSAGHTTGISEEEAGQNIDWTRLNWISRRLFFNQFLGQHKELIGKLDLDWQFNFDIARRDQPDMRTLLYVEVPGGCPSTSCWAWKDTGPSGERLYNELDQHDFGGGLNLSHPLWDGKLGTGYMTRHGNRGFVARRFSQDVARGSDPDDKYLDANELFAPENQGVTVDFKENTRDTDGYVAEDHLHAGYLALDRPWNSWLKTHAGVRVEAFTQSIQVDSPFSGTTAQAPTERTDVDGLPSAALNFALNDKMSIRTAYGGTVGRPMARELAPFQTEDYTRRRTITGNPDLQRTYIHNMDVRWELFPSTTEVLAASAYYKAFRSPIEPIIQDTNGNVTFENAEDAQNVGVELEARLSLRHFSQELEFVTAQTNVSLTYSRVTLSEEQASKATEQERRLAGQSPWVINFSLGYEKPKFPLRAFVYYNVFGPRIVEVGSLGLPDVEELPFHALDASVFYDLDEHWVVSLMAKNLAARSVRIMQGDFVFERYQPGTEVAVRLTWRN